MSRYRLSRQAETDLEQIASFVAAQSPTAAARIIDALHGAFQVLGANPHIGSLRRDLMPDLRMFVPRRPASSYIIFYYALQGGGVEISDVVHASRDWMPFFASGQRGVPPGQ